MSHAPAFTFVRCPEKYRCTFGGSRIRPHGHPPDDHERVARPDPSMDGDDT